MEGFIAVMAAPLAACLLLVVVHAALGRHVLARGVIFVDLAMAQIAALGGAVAFLRGADPHDPAAYVWSFAFTLLGAVLFSFLWDRNRSVLQEAFIGIAFSLSSAAAVLLLSNAPHGAEHLQGLLTGGGLLWLDWIDVGVMALLYAPVGLFLWFKDGELSICSSDPVEAARRGLDVRIWDFMFYAAFGLVVTSSVKAAGVLAVFSFLIVPTVCAVLLGLGGKAQMRGAWILGSVGSLVATILSYSNDWPTGSTVVCVFGVMVVAVSLLSRKKAPLSRQYSAKGGNLGEQ